MYMAVCENWNAGDTFTSFGKTKEEALNIIIFAYKNWYEVDDEWVQDEHPYYKTVKEYLIEDKGLKAIKCELNMVNINGTWRNPETTEFIKEA